MKGKNKKDNQLNLFMPELKKIINPNHALIKLEKKIPWDTFEKSFSKYYSKTGRPAKNIRLMVSIMILKQMYNLSDETVVKRWAENPYYQYFSGETLFQWEYPVHPTDLTYFRKRIGKKGVEKILKVSVEIHGNLTKEKEVLVDTTVQEKNITYPTDVKLYKKIIVRCVKIARQEKTDLRQSYKFTLKKLILAQRFGTHPRNRKKAKTARRKLKTISGRLIRELKRNLSKDTLKNYSGEIELFEKILSQTRNSKKKIYSLHEPSVYCMSKGKAHKKYEFGSKASVIMTKKSGIIVGALNIPENKYDGHTLPEALEQLERLVGRRPKVAICDRGYRGKSKIDGVKILSPKPPGKKTTEYEKRKARNRFRRRAGIEPVIGHLKSDFRLARNYLKGSIGDSINLMLAAAAFNFKKYMRRLEESLNYFLKNILNNFRINIVIFNK
ncbi:MAG: IS5 family transposase [Desulfobacterales bacterium]|nr:IS5 family transposase [Desulfobacterales bacterium]